MTDGATVTDFSSYLLLAAVMMPVLGSYIDAFAT